MSKIGLFLLLFNAIFAIANLALVVTGVGDAMNLAVGMLNAIVCALLWFVGRKL